VPSRCAWRAGLAAGRGRRRSAAYLAVLSRLTDPAAHGGDPADSFTVVAPALPGYGFSDRCLDRRPNRLWIADLFHRLMVQLGYPRYVAHGDDIGGGVINRLGLRNPPELLALQTANPISPYLGPTDTLTPAEQSFVDASDRWDRDIGAYDHVQATRPRTLSFALNDSPAGLAAWILEKWLTWSDPATRDRLSPDDLLTNVMIYWLTQTIGSSMRLYTPATAAGLGPGGAITTATSVLIPHEPHLPVPPEKLATPCLPCDGTVRGARPGWPLPRRRGAGPVRRRDPGGLPSTQRTIGGGVGRV
jgi:pimeloyl-ACP methyl ester carboxylesterase